MFNALKIPNDDVSIFCWDGKIHKADHKIEVNDVKDIKIRFNCANVLEFWCELYVTSKELTNLFENGECVLKKVSGGQMVKNSKPIIDLKFCLCSVNETMCYITITDRNNPDTFFESYLCLVDYYRMIKLTHNRKIEDHMIFVPR